MKMKEEAFVGEDAGGKFGELCGEVLPLLGEIERLVRSRGVKAMVSITTANDGYLSFSIHGSQWRMVKIDGGSTAKIYCGYDEVCMLPQDPIRCNASGRCAGI